MKQPVLKQVLIVFVFFMISIGAAYSAFSFQSKNNVITSVIAPPDYAGDWKKVEQLEQKGLTQSALDVVDAIYKKAKADKNDPQLVKSIIYRMKLVQIKEEDATIKSITVLTTELKTAAAPLKQILHSLLAEVYSDYYYQNRWKFHNRTALKNIVSENIATWDITTIFSKIGENYNASLTATDKLKQTPVESYAPVLLEQKSTRFYRPTLFDFLAHRAIDFYKNEEMGINRPAYKYELNDPALFSSYTTFAALPVNSADSLSSSLQAIKLFQELIRFHSDFSKNNYEKGALVEVDIERLNFVQQKSVLNDKDSLCALAFETIEKQFKGDSISALATYERAVIYSNEGNRYIALENVKPKWKKKEAYELCKEVIKNFPGTIAAKNCKALQLQIEEHDFELITEKTASPDKPSLARLSFKNLKKIYFRIAQLNPKEEEDNKPLYSEEQISHYLKLPVVKEWSLELPDEGDFQNHAIEIKIPELGVGEYVILAGSSKEFSTKGNGASFNLIKVSNISYLIKPLNNYSIGCMVQNRETGIPLKGVTVQLYTLDKYDYTKQKGTYSVKETYTTDDNGFFMVSTAKEYRKIRMDFSYNSSATSKNKPDYLRGDEELYQNREPEPENEKVKTFFYTDRAIYRPGQTIYFKGIILSIKGEKNEIVTNKKTTVKLRDVNQQELAVLELTSNEYGSITGSFTAPTGVLNGEMSINNESGATHFSVEEYKRPKFELRFWPIKGNYRLNEEITVSGKAATFSGSDLSGATVRYRVIRNETFPFIFNYNRSIMPASPELEITNGTTLTSDTGSFSIRFKAIPDERIIKSQDISFSYTVFADVTDINGETQHIEQYINVGYAALKLGVAIPDYIEKTGNPAIAVTITNCNDQPVKSSCTLAVYRLKQPDKIYRDRLWQRPDKQLMTEKEFEKEFPTDQYKYEKNKSLWQRLEKVSEEIIDTSTVSWNLKALKNMLPGTYLLDVQGKDAYGEKVQLLKYFTVYAATDKQIPVNETNWFIEPIKKSYEPGEKARFIIGTKEKAIHVLWEVERLGELIKKEQLLLSNEQRMIELPIEEAYRGGIVVRCTFVKNNRVYQNESALTVPYTNKELDIQFETFRNKLLPGSQEEWRLKLKDKKGEKVIAEMMAVMYDASLDKFRPNSWSFDIYNKYARSATWRSSYSFGFLNSYLIQDNWNNYADNIIHQFDALNWFGYFHNSSNYYEGPGRMLQKRTGGDVPSPSVPMQAESFAATAAKGSANEDSSPAQQQKKNTIENLSTIATRKNFSETAFFYPQLQTDNNGAVIIKYTVPEAITKWKMLGLAHTKDLKTGLVEKEVITEKPLMVFPNIPRFLRENDTITIKTKINNLSDNNLNGQAQLFLYDAITMKELSSAMLGMEKAQKTFILSKKQNTVVSWTITVPSSIDAITCKIVAQAGNYSDGEETTIPVLTNRMLVTESLPLYIRSNQTKNFRFDKLANQNNQSTTLRNHRLTLELTSNPAWYAIQALPYLMESPYDCAEQVFSRFYANSLATTIANASPKIKAVFDNWRNVSGNKETLLSNLEKNEELKSLLLEETPWVIEAKDETERKKRIGLLFDLNTMTNGFQTALQQLTKQQMPSGGWAWFDGMPEDRYITQYIVSGMGHLNYLKVESIQNRPEIKEMIRMAFNYLDKKIQEDYELLLKDNKNQMKNKQLGAVQIQYLYARSSFKELPFTDKSKIAFDYYFSQAEKYWLEHSRALQGMIALTLSRYDKKEIALNILKSLKENAIVNEEMGMYWKDNYESYYWYQSAIEAQAVLIEAFDEIAADTKTVDQLKIWLLRSKQTQNWKSTTATAEAIYALLLRGSDLLFTENSVSVNVGNKTINPAASTDESIKAEAGTGYLKTTWMNNEITSAMADVTMVNKGSGISWGALYWQYFEQLDKITPSKTPLQLKKQIFLQKTESSGNVLIPVTAATKLKTGDKLIIRVELYADRTMEYLHLKDMHASGLEPVNVRSSYKYQDGLGYYETTKDASTNFFISYLPKGYHVFEYPLMIANKGNFSNGITTIQCMYAPEFTSHSEGIRLHVAE